MDERFREYYHQELEFVREMGAEFAREFPKIARRLGIQQNPEEECPDPYVERLLEGFAFLAARVHLKLDAEFPRFTQALLETVYPHFLSPTPSMTIAGFDPESAKGELKEGYTLERDSVLRSLTGAAAETACEYRTAHEVTLYPIEVRETVYYTRELEAQDLPDRPAGQAALRIRLGSTVEDPFEEFSLDSLPFYLGGVGRTAMGLYEELFGHCTGVVVQQCNRPVRWRVTLGPDKVHQVGFGPDQKLLPYDDRSFQGYRLLHEYFAFPHRFMFYRLSGLQEACNRCVGQEMDVFFLFDRAVPELERRVDQSHARLFCAPAINLFDKRMDPIYLEDRFSEFHVVPDKTRPQDFEIYDVTRVEGLGSRRNSDQEFLPFYRTHHGTPATEAGAYYTVNRRPRRFSAREKKSGPRSSYHGSEVFISLVDSNSTPYHPDLKQLHVDGRCTNRDLPLEMPRGAYSTDFTVEDQAPVASVRCVSGPTRPRPSVCEGEEAWQAISHLSLNYLSLADTEGGKGAEALKEILLLYCPDQATAREKQIQGISDITTEPIVRRISGGVPPAFARGLQVQVRLQEEAFEGTGPFLLGAVLERFFSEYASINSFTETVIESSSRGEIKRWPLRTGKKNSL